MNDQIAAAAFGAEDHFPPTDLESLLKFDTIFVTMWKVRESFELHWMDVVHQLKAAGKQVVLFQEAEISWPLNRSWEEQKSFFEILGKVDLFLTHNRADMHLWAPFRKGKPSQRWRTCLDIDQIKMHAMLPASKVAKPLLFGSSFDGRANGLTGLIACKDFSLPLLHQNRSVGYEERNTDMAAIAQAMGVSVKEIPNSGWHEWLSRVSESYIAVHPMPAAAAGRDQLAFAALGIPCIGNAGLDIQLELFPKLAVTSCFDVCQIRERVSCLLEDPEFYMRARDYAFSALVRHDLKAAADQAKEIKESLGWA